MRALELEFFAKSACRAYTDTDANGERTGREIWSLTVAISELPQHLPYGPNARNATLEAKTSKAMLKTLSNKPEEFVFYNSGLMIIAKSISASRIEGGDFRVRMSIDIPTSEDEGDFIGHGVLNGGHTYMCLMHALYGNHKRGESYLHLSRASVQVSIAVGIEEDKVLGISQARNFSLAVPVYGLKNLNRDWNQIKDVLPDAYRKNVVFKPNEDQEFGLKTDYDVTDLVRRLALLNNKLFDFREDKHPIKAYNSLGSLVQSWEPSDYKEVLPLLGDILWLEEQIMDYHISLNGTKATGGKIVLGNVSGCKKAPMKLITGKTISYTIGEIYYMCVLAAFRVLIKNGQWIGGSREEVWQRWGPKLVERMWATYKSEGRSSASAFAKSKSTWSTLTNLVAMQFVQMG